MPKHVLLHYLRTCGRLFAAASLALPLWATEVGVSHYAEPGFNPGRDYVNQHFAEHIDPLNGNLTLQYVDIFIPGPGGLDIKVQRSYNLLHKAQESSAFGRGWDIHFGRVLRTASASCLFSLNLILELPDGSQQILYKSNVPGMDATSDFVSQRMWRARCDTAGPGVIVFSPDGTRYEMTVEDGAPWRVSRIVGRDACFSCNIVFTYRSVTGSTPLVPDTVKAWGSSSPQVVFHYTTTGLLQDITAVIVEFPRFAGHFS